MDRELDDRRSLLGDDMLVCLDTPSDMRFPATVLDSTCVLELGDRTTQQRAVASPVYPMALVSSRSRVHVEHDEKGIWLGFDIQPEPAADGECQELDLWLYVSPTRGHLAERLRAAQWSCRTADESSHVLGELPLTAPRSLVAHDARTWWGADDPYGRGAAIDAAAAGEVSALFLRYLRIPVVWLLRCPRTRRALQTARWFFVPWPEKQAEAAEELKLHLRWNVALFHDRRCVDLAVAPRIERADASAHDESSVLEWRELVPRHWIVRDVLGVRCRAVDGGEGVRFGHTSAYIDEARTARLVGDPASAIALSEPARGEQRALLLLQSARPLGGIRWTDAEYLVSGGLACTARVVDAPSRERRRRRTAALYTAHDLRSALEEIEEFELGRHLDIGATMFEAGIDPRHGARVLTLVVHPHANHELGAVEREAFANAIIRHVAPRLTSAVELRVRVATKRSSRQATTPLPTNDRDAVIHLRSEFPEIDELDGVAQRDPECAARLFGACIGVPVHLEELVDVSPRDGAHTEVAPPPTGTLGRDLRLGGRPRNRALGVLLRAGPLNACALRKLGDAGWCTRDTQPQPTERLRLLTSLVVPVWLRAEWKFVSLSQLDAFTCGRARVGQSELGTSPARFAGGGGSDEFVGSSTR